MSCPHCKSERVGKNGRDKYGEQTYQCKGCNRHFRYERAPKAAKSGVIPVPCREREFKPLRRNPFAHAELALLIR